MKVQTDATGATGAAGSDGVSALTAFLTNDSHTLPLSGSGNIISFAGANTDILVFQGVTDVTDNFEISRTPPSHITTTLSGDTVTITNSTTPYSGSIVITATSASVTLNKTMSVAVALQGDDGTDGTPGSEVRQVRQVRQGQQVQRVRQVQQGRRVQTIKTLVLQMKT